MMQDEPYAEVFKFEQSKKEGCTNDEEFKEGGCEMEYLTSEARSYAKQVIALFDSDPNGLNADFRRDNTEVAFTAKQAVEAGRANVASERELMDCFVEQGD